MPAARSAHPTRVLRGRDSRGAHVARHRARLDAHQGVPGRSDDPATVLAVGSHEWENAFVGRRLDLLARGRLVGCAGRLRGPGRRRARARYGVAARDARRDRRLGDDARLPRVRRARASCWCRSAPGATPTTERAAAVLSELFGVNIPLRWSIAHLYQAILDDEPHVPRRATSSRRSPATCTGSSPAARCSASATRPGCSPSTPTTTTTTRR